MHGKYGQPCPVCGTTVQRIVYADNEANYCPTCQTGGQAARRPRAVAPAQGRLAATLEELEEQKRERALAVRVKWWRRTGGGDAAPAESCQLLRPGLLPRRPPLVGVVHRPHQPHDLESGLTRQPHGLRHRRFVEGDRWENTARR